MSDTGLSFWSVCTFVSSKIKKTSTFYQGLNKTLAMYVKQAMLTILHDRHINRSNRTGPPSASTSEVDSLLLSQFPFHMKLDLCWKVQQWITIEDWWQPSVVTKQSHKNLWCLQQCSFVIFFSSVMESGWFERFWTLGNPWEFSCTSCDPTGTCQKADNSRWSTSIHPPCYTELFWLVFTQVSQEMDTT